MMIGIEESALRNGEAKHSKRLRRVLVVCRSLGRSSEVWLHRQIAGFERLEPSVLCWGWENREIYPLPGIDVTEASSDPWPQNGRARWWWRLRNLPGRNFYGTIGRERRELIAAAAAARPDVMLCQFGTIALRMLPVARELKIPMVAHFHGVDVTEALANPWYRNSLRRHILGFAAMIVVAEYQRRILTELGAPAGRIHVIPCGVPVDEVEQAGAVGQNPCRFLAVGRLVEKKAPDRLLEAFASCLAEVPGCTLSVIGDGPLLGAARDAARSLQIGDRVRFLGSQPNRVVAAELARASAFVQHSVTSSSGDREGWPVSIAEAMAAGLPVVATRHAGIEQQVVPGETGQLVEEYDAVAMGRRMAELAADPDLRVRLGRRGREIAVERFDQRKMICRLGDVLQAAAAGRRP